MIGERPDCVRMGGLLLAGRQSMVGERPDCVWVGMGCYWLEDNER